MVLPKEKLFQEYAAFITDVDRFYASLCLPLPPCLRTNNLRITPLAFTEILEAQAYRVRPTLIYVILAYHKHILGCGLYTGAVLLSQIPRSYLPRQ